MIMSLRNEPSKKKSVHVVTLGCSKNLVDSEQLMRQLQASEFEVTHDAPEHPGGTVIINTCGFIANAREESVNTILEFAKLKEEGKVDQLLVTGCLIERYREELEKEIPEVDAWFGTARLPEILKYLQADYRHEQLGERLLSTPGHYAYLKISEGCSRTCAFCAIPLMRGKHLSRPIEEIVREAEGLAAGGTRELILIAQELTYYGLDLYKKRLLPNLLRKLARVEGIEWIRLHYAYPNAFPLEVLDVMREEPKICRYLDIPVQHASDKVLARMHRQTTRKEIESLLKTIRERVPGIALRTTLLTGFPGETEEDFRELLSFVREQRFERLGVFTYSHEEGTAAYQLKDDIPQEEKERRAEEIMAV